MKINQRTSSLILQESPGYFSPLNQIKLGFTTVRVRRGCNGNKNRAGRTAEIG